MNTKTKWVYPKQNEDDIVMVFLIEDDEIPEDSEEESTESCGCKDKVEIKKNLTIPNVEYLSFRCLLLMIK